ncbi:MAG: 23S rRNA (pseudouridine(1915)-N(3))-methyltransferase RlmH [Rhodospirillales bacterium]|nr:23S rRNA (pseudouridine(1915)-N(3))-methyltransferase RlmH [Rhodospirillales bacterium]
MRIQIVAVGRLKSGPERTLFEHYAERVTFPFSVREVEEKRKLSPPELKAREGELLMAELPQEAIVVALDQKGTALPSAIFAQKLKGWRDTGVKTLAFAIGGAEGLDFPVLQRANMILSLGAQTWPHMLVRGMLAEQIFRAQCIITGHPYHRE